MLQMDSGYPGVALHGRMEPFSRAHQGYQNPFIPRDAPCETSLGYSRKNLSTDDFNRYGNYRFDHPRGVMPGAGTVCYQSYGGLDPYRRPSLESRDPIPMGATDLYGSGMVESHNRFNGMDHYEAQRTSFFSHNTLGRHSSLPGGFGPDQLAPRGSRHLPGPSQISYGRYFNSFFAICNI